MTPSVVVTVNCPDKTGLGCDLCHILLFFGLSVTKGDVTEALYKLELIIQRVKVSTTLDRTVVDLFFLIDDRELLHTKKRQEETYRALKNMIWDSIISCDIENVGAEITSCSQASSFLPSVIAEDIFSSERSSGVSSLSFSLNSVSTQMANSLSPTHTLAQIGCPDHKGLLYDIMRTLKDYNIQVEIGRHMIGDREFEVYRVLLDKKDSLCIPRRKVEEGVWKVLMGWE